MSTSKSPRSSGYSPRRHGSSRYQAREHTSQMPRSLACCTCRFRSFQDRHETLDCLRHMFIHCTWALWRLRLHQPLWHLATWCCHIRVRIWAPVPRRWRKRDGLDFLLKFMLVLAPERRHSAESCLRAVDQLILFHSPFASSSFPIYHWHYASSELRKNSLKNLAQWRFSCVSLSTWK